MSNFFKKALGLFVEFEPEVKKQGSWGDDGLPLHVKPVKEKQETSANSELPMQVTAVKLSQADTDKFEKHLKNCSTMRICLDQTIMSFGK